TATAAVSYGQQIREYKFPVARPHAGMIIGNGTQGLMIWGSGNHLNISIGHNGFWDHRWDNRRDSTLDRVRFQQVKEALTDGETMSGLLNKRNKSLGLHRQLGGGNLEIVFPQGYTVSRGTLDMATASGRIYLAGPGGQEEMIVVRQLIRGAKQVQLAWIDFPGDIQGSFQLLPSW